MSYLEISLIIGLIVMTCVAARHVWMINNLRLNIGHLQGLTGDLQRLIDTKCEHIKEIEKKNKMSDDVLEILNDLKKGGALLEVTRVDKNDIFFHNGGLYR